MGSFCIQEQLRNKEKMCVHDTSTLLSYGSYHWCLGNERIWHFFTSESLLWEVFGILKQFKKKKCVCKILLLLLC